MKKFLIQHLPGWIAPILMLNTASAWTPGTYPAAGGGFTVNTQSRNDVLAFWQGVYRPSDDFEASMGWTGSYATTAGAQGTNSATFITNTERRLNYFRAMAGVPATATLNTASLVNIQGGDAFTPPANTTKAQAVQRAALMIVMNYNPGNGSNPAYTHNPPVNATWDAIPWNAMNKGNITQGFHGPNAMSAYMAENAATGVGSENSAAGHRRWMLSPTATNFATGDVPGRYDYTGTLSEKRPANVLYVIQNAGEIASSTPAFTPYPPAGFFPAPLNSKYWSLSYPGADFSAATVSVSVVGGGAVAAVKQPLQPGYGDATMVWLMPPADAATSFPADTTYSISISGISGTGVPTSCSYQVTLVNPEILLSDQTLTGTASPNPSYPAYYSFTPPPLAEALRVNTYRQITSTWTENAEVATPTAVTDSTDAAYPLLYTKLGTVNPIAGSRSFRLTHPVYFSPTLNGVPEQSFQIGRKILPKANANLTFKYKRGFMERGSHLAIEMSGDGGVTWTPLGDIQGKAANQLPDNSATTVQYPLTASLSPIQFRFRYYAVFGDGSIYANEQFPTLATGILIDDITVTNCDFLDPRMSNELSGTATNFTLDATTRGGAMAVGEQWQLSLQTKLGNRWYPDGPLKTIVASSVVPPYDQWVLDNPGLTGSFTDDDDGDGLRNGVEFAFFTNPLTKTMDSTEVIATPGDPNASIRFPLASARAGAIYGAECSESLDGDWSSANVTVLISGGYITATVPRPVSGRCFLRWKISLP